MLIQLLVILSLGSLSDSETRRYIRERQGVKLGRAPGGELQVRVNRKYFTVVIIFNAVSQVYCLKYSQALARERILKLSKLEPIGNSNSNLATCLTPPTSSLFCYQDSIDATDSGFKNNPTIAIKS